MLIGGVSSGPSIQRSASSDSLKLPETEKRVLDNFKVFDFTKFSRQKKNNIQYQDVVSHLKELDSNSHEWHSLQNFEGNLSSLRVDYQVASLNKFDQKENPSLDLLKNTAKELAIRLEAKIEKNKKFSIKNITRKNTIKRLTKRLHNIQYLLENFSSNTENQIVGTIGWGEHCSIQLEKKAGISQLDGVIVKEGNVIKYYQLSTSIDVFGRQQSKISKNLINQKDLYTIGDDDSSSVISGISDDVPSMGSIGVLEERIAPEKYKVRGQGGILPREKPKVRFQDRFNPYNRPPRKTKLHEDPPSLAHGRAQPLGNVGSAVIGLKHKEEVIDLESNSINAQLKKVSSPSSVPGSQVSLSGGSSTSSSSSDSRGSTSLTDTPQTSLSGELNQQKQDEGGVLGLVNNVATQVGDLAKGLFGSAQPKGSSNGENLKIPSGESLAKKASEDGIPDSTRPPSSPSSPSSPKSPNSQDGRLNLGGISHASLSSNNNGVLGGVASHAKKTVSSENSSHTTGALRGPFNSLSSKTSEKGLGRLDNPKTPRSRPPQSPRREEAKDIRPSRPLSPSSPPSSRGLGGVGKSAGNLHGITGLRGPFNSSKSQSGIAEQEGTSTTYRLADNLNKSLEGLHTSDATSPQKQRSNPTFSEDQDPSLDTIRFMEKITMQESTKQNISSFISKYQSSSSPNTTYPSSKQASAVEAYIRGADDITIAKSKQAVQKMIIHKARADETLKKQLLGESRQGQSAGLSSDVKPFISLMSMLDKDAQKIVRYELSISELSNQELDQGGDQTKDFKTLSSDLTKRLTDIGRGQDRGRDSNSESVTDCFERLAKVVKFEDGGQYCERLNDISKINDSALKDLLQIYQITPQKPKGKSLKNPWGRMSDDEKIKFCKLELVADLNSKIKHDVASVSPLVTAIESSSDLQTELLNQLGMKDKSKSMKNFLENFPSQAQQEGHDKISENFKNTLQQLKTVSKIKEMLEFKMPDSQKSDLKSSSINLKIESTQVEQSKKIERRKNEIKNLFEIESNDVDELIKEFTTKYYASKAELPSFLNQLFPNNTEAQKNFVANYLYPLVATQIQYSVLQSSGNSGYVANPANSNMIRQLIDDHGIDKALDFIGQSFWGFNDQGDSRSPAISTLLSTSQLSAVLGMCKVAKDGRSQTIKLKAGEGKTYLSKIAPKLFPETFKFPIIHIAPFAQDDIGEELTKDNFNRLESGKHYWVKAETLQSLLDRQGDQKIESLKKSYIFCDEYDRYLPLTKKLSDSGITRQCLMSATDDLKILKKRYENAYSRLDTLVNRNFLASFPERLGFGYSDIDTAKSSSEEFKKYLDDLNPKESTLSTKLTSLTNKLRGYVDRYVDQIQHEFKRDMAFKQITDNSDTSLSHFLPSKDEINRSFGANQGLKKLQIIMPSLEIVSQKNEIQQDGIVTKKPNTIAEEISRWKSSVGITSSVFVHFLAPKGMGDFKEGASVVCKISKEKTSFISLDDVNKDPRSNDSIHLCIYDRFNKVGGDFGKWSEGVDYQALDTRIPESDGDLSESLLYQLSCRNRPGSSGKKCELTLFTTNKPANKDIFLQNLKEKESKLTAQRIKEQTLAKYKQKRNEFLKIAIYDFINSISDEVVKNNMKEIVAGSKVGFKSNATKIDVSEIILDKFLNNHFSENKHYTIDDVAGELNQEYLKLIKSQYFEQKLLANMEVKTIAEAVKAIVSPLKSQRTKFRDIGKTDNPAGKQVYDKLKELGLKDKGIEKIKEFDTRGIQNISSHIGEVLDGLGNPKKLAINPSPLLKKAQTRYEYYKPNKIN